MDDVQRFANTTVQRMMVGPGGEAKPAYLPLLSDIKGYLQHGGVAVFVQWLFKNHVFVEEEIVPKDVMPIFDLVPTFDAESTLTFAFPLIEKHVFIGAKTNSIHVLRIENRMSILKINVFSGVTKKNGVHYHRISVCGQVPSDVDKAVFPEGEFVLCWNAKDISRPSFMHNFRNLYDSYKPMLFIITEACPHDIILWKLVATLPGPYQHAFSGYDAVGGVMLLWNKLVEPYFNRRSSCLTGHIMGVEIEPGPSIVPTRFDDVIPQEVHYPANEYDDIQD
ncbi:uncharacterized protein LOC110720085 [Chenopodium quinoa]|uniref:uncharacterized protein LOC110720085 n=1 Tax=Chenopodium quinoa TaxID=63459 RepID=UPI000B779F94|nr:uncharacterized protein LOC110720085 [Chenopodium quinoa]